MFYPAESTLNGAINDSVTTIVVTSAASFNSGTPTFMVVEKEIVDLSGATLTGNTFTNAVRGALGTSAASHLTLAKVFGLFSSDYDFAAFGELGGFFDQIAAELSTLETRAASSTPGPINQVDASSGRDEGTIYHNTTGNPIFVSVNAAGHATNPLQALSDDATPPTLVVAKSLNTDPAGFQSIFFIVPADHFYQVSSPAGGGISTWIEWNSLTP